MLSPVAPAHGRGGVQDIVWALCRGLGERGHDVTLITTGRSDGIARESDGRVTIEYLTSVLPMRPTGAWARASRGCVERLHAEHPFDALHSQSFCGLHLAGALPGVGLTVSLHGTHVDELRTRAGLVRESLPEQPVAAAKAAALWLLMLARYVREGPAVRRADAVIATSIEQRAVLLTRYGVCEERLHDVWNGIDATQFSPRHADPELRARLGASGEAPLVLAVARLYQEKGIQHALRAWPKVLARHPHAVLAIVGDGPYRAELESLSASLRLGAGVRFLGSLPLDALPAHYAACDLFVNPTVRINGYDLTILQAMAHAKPVVVSNIGSVPTAVRDDREGLLAPPGDPSALADRIVAVLDDPGLASRLGLSGRLAVEQRFSLGAMVDGTLEAYASAAKRAKKRMARR